MIDLPYGFAKTFKLRSHDSMEGMVAAFDTEEPHPELRKQLSQREVRCDLMTSARRSFPLRAEVEDIGAVAAREVEVQRKNQADANMVFGHHDHAETSKREIENIKRKIGKTRKRAEKSAE